MDYRRAFLVLLAGGLTVAVEAAEPPARLPPRIALAKGEVVSLTVDEVTRVAVGDPAIVDAVPVSIHEVLLQAKAAGTTNLIVWDRAGKQEAMVEVTDRTAEMLEQELHELLWTLKLPGVQIAREGGKLFLTGEVSRQEELDRLEQMLSVYPAVTNLVSISVAGAAQSESKELPPVVKLAVQVLEITRTDLERLGVNWSSSVTAREPEATDLTWSDTLFRWGTSLTRDKLSYTLNALVQKNRARILAEPKLVTTSGKQASSHIGVDVPILTATTTSGTSGSQTASIEFRKTGVLLTMTPTVYPKEQKIHTVIEAEVSTIDRSADIVLNVPLGGGATTVPGFATRKTNTEVTAASGETIMIAGLLQAEDTKAVNQVPAFGSMPVFGRLFRSPEDKLTQRELIITVTPELVGDDEDKALAMDQALAVSEVTTSPSDPTLRYALQVQERIAKSLKFPEKEAAAGRPAEVKLRLHLLRDGTLQEAQIMQSSGFEAFDHAAVRAANSQSPFPMFPAELVQPELWLDFPVAFYSSAS